MNQNVNKELLKFAKSQVELSASRVNDASEKLIKFKEKPVINLEQEATAKVVLYIRITIN